MMDAKEAEKLFREFKATGDREIRNKLVENYMYIAEILAKKFVGRGVEYDDLFQVATEGLILGVEKYDPDMGNQFTTYITPTVTGVIKNYFRDCLHTVRPPRKLYSVASSVRSEVNEYYKQFGAIPTVKQLSQKLGFSEEQVIEALEYRSPISLDTRISGDDGDNDRHLYDVIPDNSNNFEKFEDKEALREEIAKLDPTEQRVISLRFIQGKSQFEAGKILGVSQMFVSRAERKILEKLRDALQ